MSWRVFLSLEARAQLEAAALWWDEQRSVGRDVLLTEFEDAIDRIRTQPEAAPTFRVRRGIVTRRLLLRLTRYHVYYSIDGAAGEIRITAVWHGSRHKGPRL